MCVALQIVFILKEYNKPIRFGISNMAVVADVYTTAKSSTETHCKDAKHFVNGKASCGYGKLHMVPPLVMISLVYHMVTIVST